MANAPIDRLVIVGVGLIGGSFALALRRAGRVRYVVGVGRSRENLQRALERRVIDEIASDMPSALKGADVVLLATPVGQISRIMAHISPHLGPGTLVTDAGSTKQDVVAAAYRHLSGHLGNVVPAHPIAGAESSGVESAGADLYRNKNLILTPLVETSPEATERVAELWQACGANVLRMDAARHDGILAAVSHLPHMLAFLLMNHASSGTGRTDDPLPFAGSGFRDFTRIAGSSPEMWRDICLANREALLREIDAYLDELAALRDTLAQGDGPALERIFSMAREARQKWLETRSAT
ncbi:prephenate dehydrogenase/arogenate dehydrogenase family protein [Nitrosovibrio sp. Nv17]|uniref:prephenate dehydrogenase n=1 Tax=Nitrosovibrio sp. Nv17 TaxID=1855339 RepID=UPI000909152C|nr:prephenate dehydrogenase/arogenate dehydrogenase family protein [Nitrosovibrio sp. Nv17]SFW19284.1 prephenate dehydrogenase [Nitrosovibrio sp. Nv17]